MTHRIYHPHELISSQSIYIENDEHHHLSKVMRIQEGQCVEIVNGFGTLAIAKIIQVEKKKTLAHLLETTYTPKDPQTIAIAVPLMRSSKLEYVFEKGTELGADLFILYEADNSTLDSLRPEKTQRLENIIIAALKQSKRLYLPRIEILSSLELALQRQAQIYFGDVRECSSYCIPKLHDVTLFISGPESGFSQRELSLLEKKGNGIKISPNVLRAETAPLVALSLLCIQKHLL